MKSPFITLLIIFNLLAINLASASNIYDEQLSDSHLVQVLLGDAADDLSFSGCIDESSCDHFCHVTAHMVGVFSHVSIDHTQINSVPFLLLDESALSLTLDQPSEPPQNLI